MSTNSSVSITSSGDISNKTAKLNDSKHNATRLTDLYQYILKDGTGGIFTTDVVKMGLA